MKEIFASLNIRQRFTIQFLLLISVLFLFFSLSIFFFSKLYLTNRFFNRLQDRAVIVASLYIDLSASQRSINEIVRRDRNQSLVDEMLSIYSPERDKFVFSTDFLNENFHRQFINPKDTLEVINNISQKNLKISLLKIKQYWVIISAKDYWEQDALHDLRDILVVLCFVALLFIAYISWYMSDRALEPIDLMGNQLKEIFPKNLSRRVTFPNPNDEIGELAKIINQLLNRVEESVKSQKMFVANISHELKNPLTKIFTQIEILELKYRDNPEYYEKIMSLRSDTLALNQLTHSLLDLANVFTIESDLPRFSQRIDEILLELIAEYKRWHQEDTVLLNLDNMPGDENLLIFTVNKEAIKIVFKNLIENACKFSDSNSVEISIYSGSNSLVINFYNDGTPVPQEEIANILQPFFRSDATAKGKKGHGVGLAIVSQIIKLHGFRLEIEPGDTGNNFKVIF